MQNLGIISVNLWQILISLTNLTILFLLLKKFLYAPVTKMLEARRAEIDTQYDDAETARRSAEAKDAELTERLSNAKAEAEGIVKEAADMAQTRGDKIVEDAKAQADGIIRQAELEAELARQAQIEKTTDANGLQAIKVTFNGGILFPTNGTTLSANAKSDLTKFTSSLISNPDTNVQIYGYTDDTGTLAVNERVSTGRADAVRNYLLNSGVQANRLSAQGLPMQDYVASNSTPEGRAQNRRVEIYITANQQMIDAANAGTLK